MDRTTVGHISIGTPFTDRYDNKTVHVELDCRDLIDWYAYHDAPSSIDMWFDEKDLIALRDVLSQAIEEMQKLASST